MENSILKEELIKVIKMTKWNLEHHLSSYYVHVEFF